MSVEAQIRLRSAMAEDRQAIRNLTYAAFQNHPHHAPGALPSEHLVAEKLAQAGMLILSLVAERETGDVIGHLAVSPVEISTGIPGWFGLGPVAVAPRWQKRGVGSALVSGSIAALRDRQAAGLVVFGEPAFYRRFGFRQQAALIFPSMPPAYFMALAISGEMASGEVRFQKAFY